MDGSAESHGETTSAGAPEATVPTAAETPSLSPTGPAPGRGRRGPLWVALAAVLVAGLAGGAVVANSDDDPPDPDGVLDDARATLSRADAYRFHLTSKDHMVEGDVNGPGTDTVMRQVVEGEVRGDDWHTREDMGDDQVTEVTSVGGELYVRDMFAMAGGDGTDGEWAHMPAMPAPSPDDLIGMLQLPDELSAGMPAELKDDIADSVYENFLVGMLGAWYLGTVGGPAIAGPVPGITGNLDGALKGLDDVRIVEQRADGMTLSATKSAPRKLKDRSPIPVPDGHFEIDLDADRRPVALRLTVTGKKATHQSELRWSDWDAADITVSKPGGPIDETPWLDEAGIAKVATGLTPVAPTQLPDGYVLNGIEATTAAELAADDEGVTDDRPACDTLDLYYGPPLDSPADLQAVGDAGEVDVTLLSAACARRQDETPFAPGDYGSLPVRHNADDGTVVDVLVADTVAQVSTTVGGAEKTALVTSLRPLDLDAAMAEYSARAKAGGGIAFGP